jgi:hypothetical protein
MPTGFEEASFVLKVLSLSFEFGRVTTNALKGKLSGAEFRIVSSLNTLEFEPGGRVCHVVLDRTVKILKKSVLLPSFTYGTAGTDEIQELIINGTSHKHRIIDQDGTIKYVTTERDLQYGKGARIRCVLRAKSTDGYNDHEEYYRLIVKDLTDSCTSFIIFPPDRLPEEITALYRKKKDRAGRWREVGREVHELRHFTGGRRAYILEAKNPPFGHEFKIKWKW